MYDLYVLQSSSEYEISDCSNCLNDIEELICNKVERVEIDGQSVILSEVLNEKLLATSQVDCLINHNIVKHYRIPYLLYKLGEIFFSIIKGL